MIARPASLPLVTIAGHSVRLASTRIARLRGLAFTRAEMAGGGLLIPRCRSIHTFGMRFDLDVAFLDRDGRVLAWHRGVPPRRIVGDRRAAAVLELPAGAGG